MTGTLGAAAAGLALLEGRAQEAGVSPAAGHGAELIARFLRPVPRLAEGRALAAAGVHAMIDLSDGLASDARRLAEAGGVQLALDAAALPLAPGVAEVAHALSRDPAELGADRRRGLRAVRLRRARGPRGGRGGRAAHLDRRGLATARRASAGPAPPTRPAWRGFEH